MKAAAAILVLLAAIVGVLPHFTDCQSQGHSVQMPNGKSMPMKCHWTAQAETVVAVPMALAGVLLFRGPRERNRSDLALLTIVFGVSAILIPTAVIGVCGHEEMLCSAVMKPALVVSGILAAIIGAFILSRGARGSSMP